MKGCGKILVGFSIVTFGLLLYVHERVEMLRVSYRIHQKSSALAQQSEEFRRLKFEVTQLRSPQALERRLEQLSLPLGLPKEIKVVKIPQPLLQSPVEPLPVPHAPGKLFDFVGQWIQVAQARTDQ
jgi:hypothetical protein